MPPDPRDGSAAPRTGTLSIDGASAEWKPFLFTTNDVPHRQCATELRALLLQQCGAAVANTIHKTARGVMCSAPAAVAPALARLTLPEKVYCIVLDVASTSLPSPSDEALLEVVSRVVNAQGWAAALEAHAAVHGSSLSSEPTFSVVGNRRGTRFKASISSLQFGELIGGALHEHFGWKVDLNRPHLQVSASLNDEGLFVSVALLRRADSFDCRTVGGLDPHTSWAMVRSLGALPEPAIVIDPMCGKAALLLEALNLWPTSVAIGLDCDGAQLVCAVANRAALPAPLRPRLALLQGDCATLPLPSSSCDGLVCDLPFEVSSRFGYHLDGSRGASLEACMREWARVLKCSSHAVLLTSQTQLPALYEALHLAAQAPPHAGRGGHSYLRALCVRPCPMGFTKAVIVLAQNVQLDEAAAAEDVGAVPSGRLPWESLNGRRAEWHVLRKADRAPMVPWAGVV